VTSITWRRVSVPARRDPAGPAVPDRAEHRRGALRSGRPAGPAVSCGQLRAV